MANGKAKGSGFERDICKFLTKWLTGEEKPYIWWRMPASGGLATISEQNKELSGDICSMRPEGAFLTDRFSIECKIGYPKSSFHKHLKSLKNDEIEGFWQQAVNDASLSGKRPLLIYKKTGDPVLIGLEMSVLLQELAPICEQIVDLKAIMLKYYNDDLPTIVLYNMIDFFECITPDIIKEMKCI